FSLVDSFCIQSKHYRERFLSLGIPNEKLAVTGNLKFDGTFPQTSPKKRQDMKERWLLQPNDLVLVIGSTHDPEEKIILDALEEVWKQIPNLSIILVPRHPERFDEVASLLERRKTPYRRYSQLGKGTGQEKVVLLDTMGLLRECYQLADLALVAGSFTPKVGGHNIIEPSWYGVPVLFGPHMHAQPELVEFVVKYQAGLQIRPENLTSVLLNLLGHSEKRRALGKAGLEMVDDLAGATDRTYHVIKSL
ncbi:MAG: 3-deoxy-D-manno-octulosonic acid transferase, partial [Waddliaceae bacterium]